MSPTPVVGSAVNNRTGDPVFHPGKDEYICLYFRASVGELRKEDLRVEIDGLGIPVLTRIQPWWRTLAGEHAPSRTFERRRA